MKGNFSNRSYVRVLYILFFSIFSSTSFTYVVESVMETVTLGVVGDTFVGKTLLLVSFTDNYVFKDYRPTVLNCCWTNLVVDGEVVDLTIWDNTGKVCQFIPHLPTLARNIS